MRKNDLNIAIGVAGLAAAILLFRGSGKADDSGYGGAFPLPLVMQSPGAVEPTQTISSAQGLASFQISDTIFAAMNPLPTGYSKKDVSMSPGTYTLPSSVKESQYSYGEKVGFNANTFDVIKATVPSFIGQGTNQGGIPSLPQSYGAGLAAAVASTGGIGSAGLGAAPTKKEAAGIAPAPVQNYYSEWGYGGNVGVQAGNIEQYTGATYFVGQVYEGHKVWMDAGANLFDTVTGLPNPNTLPVGTSKKQVVVK